MGIALIVTLCMEVSFVGFIIGPIILLFATNLLLAAPKAGEPTMPDRHHFEFSGRFFFLLLLVQVWTIFLDIAFDAVSWLTWLAGLMGTVFIVLVISRNYKVHLAGVALAWIALIARTILQTL